VFYIQKTIWPFNLSPYYRITDQGFSLADPEYFICTLVIVAISVFSMTMINRRPWIAAVWFSYIFTISPMLGFIQHGNLAMAADRYTYLTFFGFYLLIAGILLKYVSSGATQLRKGIIASATVIVILVLVTVPQVGTWRNTETLWGHTIEVDNANAFAYNNYGFHLLGKGRFVEAARAFELAVTLNPREMKAILNYGVTLEKTKRLDEAVILYGRSLLIYPNSAVLHNNMGSALVQLGRPDIAANHWRRAIELDPNIQVARDNLRKMGQDIQAE
jgi:Tfp pilus assembly protein PilF